jgi:hypothetical protein
LSDDTLQPDVPGYGEPEPLPADDLEHFTGNWVAVREGRVVAHNPDPEALRADPAVQEGDDIFPVGEPPSGFYTISA